MKKRNCFQFFALKKASVLIFMSLIFNPAMQSLVAGGLDDYTLRLMGLKYFEQPLVLTGRLAPNADESKELCKIFDVGRTNQAEAMGQLQMFVQVHPGSLWRPSLQSNLGKYDFDHGYYSLAMTNWSEAWLATRALTNQNGKYLADYTLVNWIRLLASLGRTNQLHDLFLETKDRTLDRGPLQQSYNSYHEGYETMLTTPAVAYRCGTLAVNSVAKVLYGTNYDPHPILDLPSPASGFTMATLVEVANKDHINLVAMKRPSGAKIIVPSVVHWRQNHYAAIIKQQGKLFEVVDPTFHKITWMSQEAIDNEASGQFLVPEKQAPNDWKRLDEAEMKSISGQGYPFIFFDPLDQPCDCPCPPGGSGGPKNGGPKNGGPKNGGPKNGGGPPCSSCAKPELAASSGSPTGMPAWRISEPYISLWLDDTPMSYQPALGPIISLALTYNQRDMRPRTPDVFDLGLGWNCAWKSYIDAGAVNTSSDPTTWPVVFYLPTGGILNNTDFHEYNGCLPDGTTLDPKSNKRVLAVTNGLGQLTEYDVLYPSGAKDIYAFSVVDDAGNLKMYLTQNVSPNGKASTLIYDPLTNYMTVPVVTTDDGFTYYTNYVSKVVVRLRYVVDADGKTNTISYITNDFSPNLIHQVTDPYGRNVTFNYDENGEMTNLVDVGGLSTSLIYDNYGWVTNMITPYGTNVFTYLNTAYDDGGGVQRANVVTEPNGSHQMCLFREGNGKLSGADQAILPAYYDGPNQTPGTVPGNYILMTNELTLANTFYWGREQYIHLSNDPLVSGSISAFVTNDYCIGRMRHWEEDAESGSDGPHQLLMECEPSADSEGNTLGEMTWYSYPGQTDPDGFWSSFFPSLAIKVLPDGTEWYQENTIDEYGNNTNIVSTYSVDGTVLTRTNKFVYAANGQDLLLSIGADGITNAAYAYDGNHQVLFMTNALGEVTSYLYNGNEQLIKTTQPNGLIISNIYGADGYLSQKIIVGYSTNSYSYTNGLVYTHTDERGLTVTNAWDALQRLTNVIYPDGTRMAYVYSNLDLVKVVDRLGNSTGYTYNAIRQKIFETNALGNVTTYSYCECGALDSIIDALGNVTSFEHDNQGNLLQTTYPDGYVINNTYDLIHQLIKRSDNSGLVITNWYNNQGFFIFSSNVFGLMQELAYDVDDRITNRTDANNVSVGMVYDNLNRVCTKSYPDGGIETYGYSFGYSEPTSYTNQIGNVTLWAYDLENRKTNEVSLGVYTNSFAYSPGSDLVKLTDGNGNPTTWGYDEYGRMTNKVDALSNVLFVYKYDPDNRLTNRWSAAKNNTIYTYDKVGNLTFVDYSNSPDITLQYDVLNRLTNMTDAVGTTKFTYDSVNQMLSEDGPWTSDTVLFSYANRLRISATVTAGNTYWSQNYAYDSARRLTGVTSPAGAFNYAYDPVMLQRVRTLSLPNGAVITNAYDSVARQTLAELMSSNGSDLDSYAYGYNQANQRTNVVRTAGDKVVYTYDNAGELLTASGSEAAGTVRAFENNNYNYDSAGNLTSKNSSMGSAFASAYLLNKLNQITNIYFGILGGLGKVYVSGSTTVPATSVTVNATTAARYADNTFGVNPGPVSSGLNTFTAIANDGYSRSSTYISTVNIVRTNNAFVYDLNGNLLYDGRRAFDYDDENQLIRVTMTNAWKSEYTYDGKLRRRIAKEFTWNGSAWSQTNETYYIYDGNVVVQEQDTNNRALVSYTRGKDLSGTSQGAGGIGGLLARTDNSQALYISMIARRGYPPPPVYATTAHAFYHTDGNGNVTMLINTSQMTVAKYLYDSFGNTLAQSGLLADANVYRFSSKEWNNSAGIYYYLYRFYDPNLQRWINRDPLGERGFKTYTKHKAFKKAWLALRPAEIAQYSSLYNFVGDMPVNRFDQFGLEYYDADLCNAILSAIDHLFSLKGRIGFDDNELQRQINDMQDEYDDNCGDDDGDDGDSEPIVPPLPPCPVYKPQPIYNFCMQHPALCAAGGFTVGVAAAAAVCAVCPECCLIAVLVPK